MRIVGTEEFENRLAKLARVIEGNYHKGWKVFVSKGDMDVNGKKKFYAFTYHLKYGIPRTQDYVILWTSKSGHGEPKWFKEAKDVLNELIESNETS